MCFDVRLGVECSTNLSEVTMTAGLLASSTGSALLRKVLFQIKGVGLGGQQHTFEKPWFTTWESAAACWVSIVIFWVMQSVGSGRRKFEDRSEQTEPLLDPKGNNAQHDPFAEAKEQPQHLKEVGWDVEQHSEEYKATWREIWALVVPGMFSVASIIVQGMGLRYLSASMSMMLSGSCVIFTAILSVIFLKCRLNSLHLSGVGLTLGGLAIVSVANLIWPEVSHATHHHNRLSLDFQPLVGAQPAMQHHPWEVVLGISLTLLSMLILAMRLVSEEFALQGTDMHPLQVLGYEGMWGTLGVGVIGLPLARLLPGEDVGDCQENTADSFALLVHNPAMNIINWLFILSVIGLNIFGLMVTRRLGSVFRAVLLTSRTASVWVIDLVLFYAHIAGGGVGEPWIQPGSWFQLFGFALLLIGTVVYAQGSSHVAQHEEHRKLAQDDPEADEHQAQERNVASAVTRLRPYTSLYIPHGPRTPRQRQLRGDGIALDGRTASLPQRFMSGSSPMTNFDPRFFERHSYTPGLLQGSSPASRLSDSSSDDRPAAAPASSSNMFLHTLTHRSSWVLPRRKSQLRSSVSSGSRLDEEGSVSGASLEGDQASSSRSPLTSSRREPPPSSFLDNAQTESASSSRLQSGVGRRPLPGQSPSPQHILEYRRSSRRSSNRMPAVEESDAEALRTSIDEGKRLVSSAPEDALRQAAKDEEQQGQKPAMWQSSREMPELKQKHVFGQSPSAPMLLSRRSTGRPKASDLQALTEDEEPSSSYDAGLDGSSQVEEMKEVRESPGQASTSNSEGRSSRSSILGQSPTPAKLMEQRSARVKGPETLPAFEEDDESGSSSSLETSSDTSLRTGGRHAATSSSDSSSFQDGSERPEQTPKSSETPGQPPSAGTGHLQWNGESMSL